MTETLNPIPVCLDCGEETTRMFAFGGKGRYACNNLECDNKNWYTRGSKKEEKQGYSDEERAEMVLRVDASHAQDYDGSRRIYADSVSTSQALIKRARASSNGHY